MTVWTLLAAPILALSLLGGASWPEAWSWWRGQDAYHEQLYPDAAEQFAAGQTGEPGAAQSKLAYNEGAAQYRAQDFVAAERAFDRAAQADETNWRALYNRGNAQVQQGYVGGEIVDRNKLLAAVASYEAALEVQPDDEDTIHNLEYVKKLLEEEPPPQQQQQQNQSQDQQNQQQERNQDQQDSGGEGDNEQQQSQNQQGDNEQDSQQGQGEQDQQQDQSGQQQPQPGQGGGQQQDQHQDQQPQPDLRYSQQMLDRLAQEEARNQHYRAMQRQEAGQDPFQDLLNQLMSDPGSLLFGSGERRRQQSPDDVDW